jgi:hypothetical protein
VIEIGGPQVLSYGDMVVGYARERGLPHLMIRWPMFSARLSSQWVHWATPIPSSVAYSLIEGLHGPVVVQEDSARRLFPEIKPMDYATVLKGSLARLDAGQVDTAWSDALATSQGDKTPVTFKWSEGMFIESRQRFTSASPEQVYRVFAGLGGERGWLYGTGLWQMRGWLTASLAAWAWAGDAAIPTTFTWEMRWTFGGWKKSSRAACSACAPR